MKSVLRCVAALAAASLLLSGCAVFDGKQSHNYPGSYMLSLTQQAETASDEQLHKEARKSLDAMLLALPIDKNDTARYKLSAQPVQIMRQSGNLEISHLMTRDASGIPVAPGRSLPGAAKTVIVVDGNFKASHASNAVIIAAGDVSISHSAGNVVVAGGDIDIGHDGSMSAGSLVFTKGKVQISHANHSLVYANNGAQVSFATGVRSFNTPTRKTSHGHVNNTRIDDLFKPEP
ncbi:hypothetical protein LG325_12335 [Marinobacter nauticus]